MAFGENSTNPFASPTTPGETITVVPGAYEVQGQHILGKDKIILPHACVKCGEQLSENDSSGRKKKDLYWVHPAIYLLVLLQLLIFLIVYLVTRKKCHVEYSVCHDCSFKLRMNWLYFVLSLAGLVGMISLAAYTENGWFGFAGFLCFIAMLVFAVRANGPITVKSYKSGEFKLRGAGPLFLQKFNAYGTGETYHAAVIADDGRMA